MAGNQALPRVFGQLTVLTSLKIGYRGAKSAGWGVLGNCRQLRVLVRGQGYGWVSGGGQAGGWLRWAGNRTAAGTAQLPVRNNCQLCGANSCACTPPPPWHLHLQGLLSDSLTELPPELSQLTGLTCLTLKNNWKGRPKVRTTGWEHLYPLTRLQTLTLYAHPSQHKPHGPDPPAELARMHQTGLALSTKTNPWPGWYAVGW